MKTAIFSIRGELFTFLFWVTTTVTFGFFLIQKANAIPGCNGCACAGMATCDGCNPAFPPGGQLGVYINVQNSPIYYYCVPSEVGNCTTVELVCLTIPAGNTITYSNGWCEVTSGMFIGALEVRRPGCNVGETLP